MNRVKKIIEALEKVKPSEVAVYDTALSSPFFDYIVVASVDSVRQADASIKYIKEGLLEAGYQVKSSEGEKTGWVLVDGYNVLVHVFIEEERARVDIDSLYKDCKKVSLQEIL